MLTGRTRLLGIIGHPIGHSLSPRMHNAAFEAMDLDYCYLPLDVEPRRLRSAVEAMGTLGFCGFNVTIPHKRRIIAHLDRLTPEARLMGAVNTVEIRRGRWVGHNTDGQGFLRAFREQTGESLAGKRALILGAGGAARAVAFQWALEGGAAVILANRTRSHAEALARDLRRLPEGRCRVEVIPWNAVPLHRGARLSDVVINATAVGMSKSDPPLLPPRFLGSGQIVCDLIYRPSVTPLIGQAQAAGAKAFNGLPMLVHQGALAFEIWTGRRPPRDVMEAALQEGLRMRDKAASEIDNSSLIQ